VVRKDDFAEVLGTLNVRAGGTVTQDFKVTPKQTPLIRSKNPR
jgi:hypothetical protein